MPSAATRSPLAPTSLRTSTSSGATRTCPQIFDLTKKSRHIFPSVTLCSCPLHPAPPLPTHPNPPQVVGLPGPLCLHGAARAPENWRSYVFQRPDSPRSHAAVGAGCDGCGTCDADPSNDCVQDCNGDWGGNALLDNCQICDSNPDNDCLQDCNGDWGGDAKLDNCNTCVGDGTYVGKTNGILHLSPPSIMALFVSSFVLVSSNGSYCK